MPTGYTHAVQSGEITEFKDFALQCARAFGALIMMRDDPLNAPIPDEFTPDDYHIKKIDEAKAEIARLQAMTVDQRDVAWRSDYQQQRERHERWEAERREQRARYDAMLAKVEAWEPPTPDHIEMKAFMRQQLTESIKFDCGHDREAPVQKSREQWFAEALAEAQRSVDYHTREHEKEVERAANRTAWIRALRNSFQ